MAHAWFLSAYRTKVVARTAPVPGREPIIVDYVAQAQADGGDIGWTEVLGNQALCKVNASAATLTTIAADANITRIPNHVSLSEPLSDLTAAQKTAIVNKLLAMGYTQGELDAASGGDWGSKTLGDLLRFICTRAQQPRWDVPTLSIVLNGATYSPSDPAALDTQVP